MYYELQQGLLDVPIYFYMWGYLISLFFSLKAYVEKDCLAIVLVTTSLVAKIGCYQLLGLWVSGFGLILFSRKRDSFSLFLKGMFLSYFFIDLNSVWYHYTIGDYAPWIVLWLSLLAVSTVLIGMRNWLLAGPFLFLGACLLCQIVV